jgi:hypothetical protein
MSARLVLIDESDDTDLLAVLRERGKLVPAPVSALTRKNVIAPL